MTIKELCTKVREAAEPFAAWGVGTAEEDAAFRKAVTPSAVLALLGRIEELEKALDAASEVVNVAEKMTGCRGDDEWIWSVQEQIKSALGGTR